jgi:hypothetical protein
MSAIINALDNYTPVEIGENGHAQYSWSNDLQERIVQLSFQLTRTSVYGMNVLKKQLHEIIAELKHNIDRNSSSEIDKSHSKSMLCLVYKMIGQTRDIVDGKGERDLSYMMIYTWYFFYPDLALYALLCFVDVNDETVHPYGSWKDIKYFCDYCKKQGETINFPLIQNAIKMCNFQLRQDADALHSGKDRISLVSKWLPREQSSFGWLYQSFATDYFNNYLISANTREQKRSATLKCKTDYRKLMSLLNNHLDTTQIKMCDRKWAEVNFHNVTSITMSKQQKAFFNTTKEFKQRSTDIDRITCANNLKSHLEKITSGGGEINGKRVGMADFTKQAKILLDKQIHQLDDAEFHSQRKLEVSLLNSQWRDNSSQTASLDKMVAMVDISGSMEGAPMDVAIALGIRIAEKSSLGKRVMTFSSTPSWVNLDHADGFVSCVEAVKGSEMGFSTNFYAAMDMILGAIVENKMKPEDAEGMVLVILSDMQMDEGDRCDKTVLYKNIETKYADAGMRAVGQPYNPPHILFWNLRSTDGFPCLSSQPNASMMSGFSPAILKAFCEQGIESLKTITPWSMLNASLADDRYSVMGNAFFNSV